MFYFYLFRCKDGSLYAGVTDNIRRREKTHNAGKGSAYVRSRGGGKMAYWEIMKNKSAALKREAEVKKWSRVEKLKLVKASRSAKR